MDAPASENPGVDRNGGAESDTHSPSRATFVRWVTEVFIDSKITPLILLFSIFIGAFAVINLPREEEPQIKVPMVDIFVRMPGTSAREIEQRVTRPMEKFLWEIPGVEYIYSTSSTGGSFVIVRFLVGHDEEDALVKVSQKMAMHFDKIPQGASPPLIKPRSIDDVPILALTFWSATRDSYDLRRVAGEVADAIKAVPDVAETTLIGGRPRQLSVRLDPGALAARGLAPEDLIRMLGAANARSQNGELRSNNEEILVQTGRFLRSLDDVRRVVVGVYGDHPVYLSDVAVIEDGPNEVSDYVFLEAGPAMEREVRGGGSDASLGGGVFPAVTISVAKRKGTNATSLVHRILDLVDRLKGYKIPSDVSMTVTRDYGDTAAEKSNELLLHMGIAVVSVSLLIWLILGWREAGIVATAIPVTLALTLAIFFLLGYTLNRITLFALIFSIGILVDDPIVGVENIVRHFRLPENKGRNLLKVTVEAVAEVGSPLVLATLAVMCAVLPMAFVRGLMGPYMRPIPIGSSSAMAFSMIISFVITPWAAYHILRGPATRGTLEGHGEGEKEGISIRLYRKFMDPLIHSNRWRTVFLSVIVALLLAACALVPLGKVIVKMLPFDNKSELQVIVDMPEGTTLEETANVARELSTVVRSEPEVKDVVVYAGTASPFNFNGLVRHYFLRSGSNVADLQVNLTGKHERFAQSHDFAKRIRPRIEEIARRRGARVKIAEVPPGPPVLQTLVAEVYGPDPKRRKNLATKVLKLFESTEGVVDVDWYVEDDQVRKMLRVDEQKAALNGVRVATVNQTIQTALEGTAVGLLHDEDEKEDVNIVLRLPYVERATLGRVLSMRVRGYDSKGRPKLVPVSELVDVETRTVEKNIYHKNLLPVTYVTGDVSGREESPAYAILKMRPKLAGLVPEGVDEYWMNVPLSPDRSSVKWDGEMHVTLEVFRDMGLAFAAVMILIYVLVVGWFHSFTTPLVIMAAIPFSLVGILPAHWAMGAFFTATSMIGFIAGAGIVVRNSIILVDFIELRLAHGYPLDQAVLDAGAIRFRPMLLTAAAVMVGAGVILFDPIFQGLAISLIAGEVASLLLSRMAVPVLYYWRYRRLRGAR